MDQSNIFTHLAKSDTIRFGTDGWRAVIGDLYTIENLKVIAQALADYLHENSGDHVSAAVGYDTRFMSVEFAEVVAEVLAANRIQVFLSTDIIPTPVLSFTVKYRQLDAGIMLTASHNPFFYHGVKFKAPFGGPATTEMTNRIAHFLNARPPCKTGTSDKTRIKKTDFFPAYHEQVISHLNIEALSNFNHTVFFDPMYGAGQGYLRKLLAGLPVKIRSLHTRRNPLFGGLYPEPILKNLQDLKKRIANEPGNLGIATDGDADRFGVLDRAGNFIAVHELQALLFTYLWDIRGWRGQVVRSTSMADSVDRLAIKRGAEVSEVPVGFKYVTEEMLLRDTLIGGEESGGFGYGRHIPERDGLFSGLLLLELLGYYKSDITELITVLRKEIGTKTYDRIDFYHPTVLLQERMARIKKNMPDMIGNYKIVKIDDKDGIKFYFTHDSWMLIRLSATEPMARIYVTAPTPDCVRELLDHGRKLMIVQ